MPLTSNLGGDQAATPLSPGSTSLRIKLDGAVKTISPPITGYALHKLAGDPASLTADGKEVPKNHAPFPARHDQEFTTKRVLAGPERIPAKDATEGAQPGVFQKPLDPEPPKKPEGDAPAYTHPKSEVQSEGKTGEPHVAHGENPEDIAPGVKY